MHQSKGPTWSKWRSCSGSGSWRWSRLQKLATGEKSSYPWIGGMVAQFLGIALCAHSLGVGIKEDRVVSDGEDAGQFMGHDHDSCPQTIAQLQDQLVQVARKDRVQPGRRFIEKKDFRVQRHSAGQP